MTSTRRAVRRVLAGFVGEIDQVPTAVSAVKVDGKRAYQRVREGEQVELKSRRVTIHDLTVLEVSVPDVRISVRCSSGTYVRAIARDAGAALGVGGHLTALRRTAVGEFGLDRRAHPGRAGRRLRDDPDRRGGAPYLPVGRARRASRRATSGSAARWRSTLPGLTAVFAPDGEFLALYENA